jgi:hypothetical protein
MERFLRHNDWFRSLSWPGGDPGRTARFMDRDDQAGGITVRVTELTGKPGDVVLTHPLRTGFEDRAAAVGGAGDLPAGG